jgi:hypothetical protein
MSSSPSVVAAVRPTGSAPEGARHRHLLYLRWWPLPDPLVAHPRGATINIFFIFSGGHCRTCQ